MVYAEFRRHLGKAGISVNEYAALLRLHRGSISNYATRDEVPHTHAIIAVLLGDAADRGIDYRSLLRRYGVMKAIAEIVPLSAKAPDVA